MCGLAGIIDPGLSREAGDLLLTKMLASIRHRGPDNSSRWIDMPVLLGHNRLSIIDLGAEANQPMVSGDHVLVYNGELYNYVELRDELTKLGHTFRTRSDTEVLLVAYREWGDRCVSRFVGMWAFAIWDTRKQELFCSRDRFGIKPFYYIHEGDRFYFGSEYKPLKYSPLFTNRFNQQQIGRGLLFELPAYRAESYFECIKVLPERSNLVFRDGRVSVSDYWDVDLTRRFRGSLQEKRERFRDLFRDSIRLHLRSDVRVGGSLSGGLDSSAITCVVGRDYPEVPYTTFTVHYPGPGGMDERRWACEVLRAYPHIEPVECSPSDEDVARCVDEIIALQDVPLRSSQVLSYYFLIQAAAQRQMKVMLDGQGADEYLAGYSPSHTYTMAGQLRRLRLLKAWKGLNSPACRRQGRRMFARKVLNVALSGVRSHNRTAMGLRSASVGLRRSPDFEAKAVGGSLLKRWLCHGLFTSPLPGLLHYQDRVAMHFSIENRVPFLDHRLVEFVLSLDDDDLVHLGQTKYIMRTGLDQYLPPGIAARTDKVMFSSKDVTTWLNGSLRHMLDTPFDFDRLEILDPHRTTDLISAFKQGDYTQRQTVWRLAVLKRWSELQ
jgi:asparagine synthase (glutamine-hydrolysing)